jgi:hypothetical protein
MLDLGTQQKSRDLTLCSPQFPLPHIPALFADLEDQHMRMTDELTSN